MINAHRPRNLWLILLFLICVLAFLSSKVLGPVIAQERSAWNAINAQFDSTSLLRKKPHLPDIVQIANLDTKLVPRSSVSKHQDPLKRRRIIFIGDIHGCKNELIALLKKAEFNPGTDHIICTGDIVGKGPDTIGVIDLLRQYRASGVRGNHEDSLLRLIDSIKSSSMPNETISQLDTSHKDEKSLIREKSPEMELALSLNSDQIQYLRGFPLVLRVGRMQVLGAQLVVVHAGLVPGLALNHQVPEYVMNMRTIDIRTHIPSSLHKLKGSIPWITLWNRYQRLLRLRLRMTGSKQSDTNSINNQNTIVIYGHDARQGLQIRKYTKGLDSRCVKGGQLTALILADGGKQDIVQVDCENNLSASAL